MASEAFAGPVDYLVFAFPADASVSTGLAAVSSRVEEGVVDVLDLEVIQPGADGTAIRGPLDRLAGASDASRFAGAYSGVLDADDVQRVADALEPGGFAIALVYEDRSLAAAAAAWTAAGGTELFAGGVDIIDLADSLESDSLESEGTHE